MSYYTQFITDVLKASKVFRASKVFKVFRGFKASKDL
jgi:hypothetical protein